MSNGIAVVKVGASRSEIIMLTRLSIYSKLYSCENDYFQMKICVIFLIFAQTMDCGYRYLKINNKPCLRVKIRKVVTQVLET